LAHEDFANGKVTTRWVEKTLDTGSLLPKNRQQAVGLQSFIAAALADLTIPFGHDVANPKSKIKNQNAPDPYSPWKQTTGFRN
jgi:hypothetical protein